MCNTGFSYSFEASHGGFDAGDGKIYFKVGFNVVPLLEATDDIGKLSESLRGAQNVVLHIGALGESTSTIDIRSESLLLAHTSDKTCDDNEGAMFVRVVQRQSERAH